MDSRLNRFTDEQKKFVSGKLNQLACSDLVQDEEAFADIMDQTYPAEPMAAGGAAPADETISAAGAQEPPKDEKPKEETKAPSLSELKEKAKSMIAIPDLEKGLKSKAEKFLASLEETETEVGKVAKEIDDLSAEVAKATVPTEPTT